MLCRRSGRRRARRRREFRRAAADRLRRVPVSLPGIARPSIQSRPGRPGPPPSAPRGAWRRRSAISEKVISRSASQLAHDPVSAAMRPRAARAAAQRVLDHAHREFALERLDRGVQGVAHRDVHPARPVRVRARALAAAEGLVVGEPLAGAAGGNAEREVVHRALSLRAAERREHEVGHARARLDVARRHRRPVRRRSAGRSGSSPRGTTISIGR